MFRCFLLAVMTQVVIGAYSPYVQISLRNKGYSHSLVGLVMAAGQAAAIVGPLVISSFSERCGRTKPFILLSAVMSAVCALPFFLLRSVPAVIFSSFMLEAFFWSINPLSDGFINRFLGDRNSEYGTIRSFGTFGYMLALLIFSFTGFPDEADNRSILTCFLSLSLVYILTVLIQGERSEAGERNEKKAVFSLFSFDRNFYIFMVIVAFTRFAQCVIDKFLASYMTETLKLGHIFPSFIALGAFSEFLAMIIFGSLLRRNRVTPLFLLFLSALGLTVRLLLYLIPSITVFAFAQTLHSLTFGACHVAATAYITRHVEPSRYDSAMSVYWAVMTNFPQLLASLIGGAVIEKWGYNTLFLSYSAFPFIAILLIVLFRQRLEDQRSFSSGVKNM